MEVENKLEILKLAIKQELGFKNEIIEENIIGVDMGATLTKIAFSEGNTLNLLIFDTMDIEEIRKFLISKSGPEIRFHFTGGKAYEFYQEFSLNYETKLIDEFKANIEGVSNLYQIQKKKALPDSIIVSIGTGTSIILKKDNKMAHIGGTALGGGMFMALARLFNQKISYSNLIMNVNKANRTKVDLQVKDIYNEEDNRISPNFREFTAATLGKIIYQLDISNIDYNDVLASINNLIAENIGLFSCLYANNNDIKDIVFLGGFIRKNKVAQRVIKPICNIHRKNCIFLKNVELAGAIGILNNREK